MHVEAFFDSATWTLSYAVHDGAVAVVIDPVRDFDPKSGRTSWQGAERIAEYLDRQRLSVAFVIDTHIHADHMTGMPFFQERCAARSVTGARVGEVQHDFRDFYDMPAAFPTDGSQFDVLLDEGDTLEFGSLSVEAIHTPGHTPAHMSWKIGDAVFLGDTLFMPDYGSARCDFPGGSAAQLYDSVQRLYRMPDATRLFMCHDYMPGGRPLRYETTVGEQKRHNVQIDAHTTKDAYVAFREQRDATLDMPTQMLASLQVNIRAGALPEPASNGISYLKIPLDALGKRT